MDSFQQEIIQECLERKYGGGLSLPMGSGKTFISLQLAQRYTEEGGQVLIVASKTLLSSWESEIKKFYQDTLNYSIFPSRNFDSGARIILSTPEQLTKYYKKFRLCIVYYESVVLSMVKYFSHITRPQLPPTRAGEEGAFLYTNTWKAFFVDEIQQYTNCDTQRCEALTAIYAPRRWGLSGTLFKEPTVNRVLGYHLILNYPNTPRCVPDTLRYIKSPRYEGIKATVVHRSRNPVFKVPRIHKQIIQHPVFEAEYKIYQILKTVMNTLYRKKLQAEDTDVARQFGASLLSMVGYLRQCLISPLIPIASVMVDVLDMQNHTQHIQEIHEECMADPVLGEFLKHAGSAKSSRIDEMLKVLDKHLGQRIIVFTSFRSCLDLSKSFVSGRPVFTLNSKDSSQKRAEIVEQFSQSENGVFFLTYQLGSEGLNLQCAEVGVFLDFWWNAQTTQQAWSRFIRYGQNAEDLYLYFFTSNTAIEKQVFTKQVDKNRVCEELYQGAVDLSKPSGMSIKEIIEFISMEDNVELIKDIYMK